jgi:hypothetical protein
MVENMRAEIEATRRRNPLRQRSGSEIDKGQVRGVTLAG